MKLLTTILSTLLLLLSSTYTAKVVRVSDGDIITVLTDNKEQITFQDKTGNWVVGSRIAVPVLRTGTLSEIRNNNMYKPLTHILKKTTIK